MIIFICLAVLLAGIIGAVVSPKSIKTQKPYNTNNFKISKDDEDFYYYEDEEWFNHRNSNR